MTEKTLLSQFINNEVVIPLKGQTVNCKLIAIDDRGVLVHRASSNPNTKGTFFYPWVAITDGIRLSEEAVSVERAA